jgi:hypothetical protein
MVNAGDGIWAEYDKTSWVHSHNILVFYDDKIVLKG